MKDNLLEFYVNKFYFSDNSDNVDLNFIPPILRRKTSTLDKIALNALNRTYSCDIENIVFSSRYGEFERLRKIIEQYNSENETSPNVFSTSVHNYPAGFFLFNIKKTIPYTSLSSMSKSFSTGLISAVSSNYNNTLFCYCDLIEDKKFSFAVNISKKYKENSMRCGMIIQEDNGKEDNLYDFEAFLEAKRASYNSSLFKIERIAL